MSNEVDPFEMLWEWETVHQELLGTSRWHVNAFTVTKHPDTGEFWGMQWRQAATENQEHEYGTPFRVEPYEETVTKYRRKTAD